MRTFRLLNLRRMRRQPLRTALAVISIAAGTALAVAILILTSSIRTSFVTIGKRLAGPAPLRVVGPSGRGGLDEGVINKIETVPGVQAAVPLVQAVTIASGPPPPEFHRPPDTRWRINLLTLGVDCRVEAIIGSLGCDPNALAQAKPTDPPLTTNGIWTKPGWVLRTDGGQVSLTGAPRAPQLERFNRGLVTIFPLRVAQQLFGRTGRVDAVYVRTAPGADVAKVKSALKHAVGPWNGVLSGDEPPAVAGQASAAVVPLFGLLSMFALGISALLVYDVASLSMEERRRDLAVVSAVGGSGRAVVGGAIAEAALIGLVGGALGVLLGTVLARSFVSALSGFTVTLLGVPLQRHVGLDALVAGIVLGVGLAAAAAWVPARRATRLDVAAELSNRELREESAARLPLRRGLVFVAIGLAGVLGTWLAQRNGALAPWQPPLGLFSVVVAQFALLLGIGSLSAVAIRSLRGPAARAGASARLGVTNLVRDPGRTGVMAVAVGAAVGIAFVTASFNQAIRASIIEGITKGSENRVWVSTVHPNNSVNIDSGISDATLDRIRHTPGVAGIEKSNAILVGTKGSDLFGVFGADGPINHPFPIILGRFDNAAFARGEVMIGPGLARRHHLRPGTTLTVPGTTKNVELKIQGVWANGDFSGNNVAMPRDMLVRIWGEQPANQVYVVPSRGTEPVQLAARLSALQLGAPDQLRVLAPRGLAELVAEGVSTQLAVFWTIQRGLMLVAFVAVLSTLLLVGVQRKRELGLLAAIGMQPRELAAMVVAEAAIVGAVGVVGGAIGGIGMFEALRETLPVVFGFHDPFRLDLTSVAVYGPIVLVVVVAAAILPAIRTARLQVLEALQYE